MFNWLHQFDSFSLYVYLQMTNISRPYSGELDVHLVYYLVEGPDPDNTNASTASRAVYLLNLLSIQEVAIGLGYPVIVIAERE